MGFGPVKFGLLGDGACSCRAAGSNTVVGLLSLILLVGRGSCSCGGVSGYSVGAFRMLSGCLMRVCRLLVQRGLIATNLLSGGAVSRLLGNLVRRRLLAGTRVRTM